MITNEEKDKILMMNKYTKTTGYIINYNVQESNNILVSREDIVKFYNQKPKDYYFMEKDEEFYDLEGSWEDFIDLFYDNFIDDIEREATEEQIEKLIKLKFL